MRTNLQAMRKRAGFKSAKAFAEYMGVNVSTYTKYEQGLSEMSLERAWEFADALHCSLDEIAGRTTPESDKQDEFEDERQANLNDYYESMDDESKAAITETARIMSGKE